MPASAHPAYTYPGSRRSRSASSHRATPQLSPWERAHAEAVDLDGPSSPAEVDPARHRYPFAVVWTPIHPITWVLPFVGHMGICDSRGIVLDFTGDIGVDDLAFGSPTRYLTLNPKRAQTNQLRRNGDDLSHKGPAPSSAAGDSDDGSDDADDAATVWDAAVLKASKMFERRMHLMICGNDCHSHVAVALNEMVYGGFTRWNKVALAAWVFFCGRHTSWSGVVQTWLGTAVMLALYIWTRH